MESIFSNTMADMNWKEIEEMGHRDIPILFPLGVIEQHGPHLPLATDIYFSYAVCRKIKSEIENMNGMCLIAPPYYWGINHCTGAFPGSFSLKEETMKRVLNDIFENLKLFGFERIYCINQHGDPLHIKTILEAIQESNKAYNMRIKMLMEPYELSDYNLIGSENYILVDKAEYPDYLFSGDNKLLDIHAGAYETAVMKYFYKQIVDLEAVKDLPDYSLNFENMKEWLKGGKGVRSVVPLGYAGNPSVYETKLQSVEAIFSILCKYVASAIISCAPENS